MEQIKLLGLIADVLSIISFFIALFTLTQVVNIKNNQKAGKNSAVGGRDVTYNSPPKV